MLPAQISARRQGEAEFLDMRLDRFGFGRLGPARLMQLIDVHRSKLPAIQLRTTEHSLKDHALPRG